METDPKKLQINPEYERLVPPPTEQEFQSLKQSIENNGQLVPDIVNETLTVVAGHLRRRACKELGLKVKYTIATFANSFEEMRFVIEDNVAGRQLKDFVKAELGVRLYEIELAERRMRRKVPRVALSDERSSASIDAVSVLRSEKNSKAAEVVAKKVGLKTTKFERSLYIIRYGAEDMKEKLRKGEIRIYGAFKRIKDERANEAKMRVESNKKSEDVQTGSSKSEPVETTTLGKQIDQKGDSTSMARKKSFKGELAAHSEKMASLEETAKLEPCAIREYVTAVIQFSNPEIWNKLQDASENLTLESSSSSGLPIGFTVREMITEEFRTGPSYLDESKSAISAGRDVSKFQDWVVQRLERMLASRPYLNRKTPPGVCPDCQGPLSYYWKKRGFALCCEFCGEKRISSSCVKCGKPLQVLSGGRLRCRSCCRDVIPVAEIRPKIDTRYAIHLVVNGVSDPRLETGSFIYSDHETDPVLISPKELSEALLIDPTIETSLSSARALPGDAALEQSVQ